MKIVMYSKETCPFCEMAKEWFDEHNIKFDLIIADDEKRNWLRETYNVKTVPQIFIDGKYFGGYRELMENAEKILDAY